MSHTFFLPCSLQPPGQGHEHRQCVSRVREVISRLNRGLSLPHILKRRGGAVAMAQWVKPSPCLCENLQSNSQNPLEEDNSPCICIPSSPTWGYGRQRQENFRNLLVSWPGVYRKGRATGDTISDKVGSKNLHPRVSADTHTMTPPQRERRKGGGREGK